MASGETRREQQDHGSNHLPRKRFADPRRVRTQDIELNIRHVARTDALPGQGTKAGINPIDRVRSTRGSIHNLTRRFDRGPSITIKDYGASVLGDLIHVRDRQGLTVQQQWGGEIISHGGKDNDLTCLRGRLRVQ